MKTVDLSDVIKQELHQAVAAQKAGNEPPTIEELHHRVETARQAAFHAVDAYFEAVRVRYHALSPQEKLNAWRAYNRACILGRYPQAYKGKPIDDDYPHPEYEGEPHPSTIDFLAAALRA